MTGIMFYLSWHWRAKRQAPCEQRTRAALQMERETLASLVGFASTWAGAFLGGLIVAVLAGGVIASGFRPDRMPPGVSPSLLLYHGLPVAWVGVGMVIWVVRPIFRRLDQLSVEIASLS